MEELARTLSTLTYLVEELSKEIKQSDPDNILARNADRYIESLRGQLESPTNK